MGIRGFERRLERLVEGAFARAFKSGLRPVELGRRLVREMDDNRSVGRAGRHRGAQRLHRRALGQRPRAVRGRAGQPRPGARRRRPGARPRRGLLLHGPGRGRARRSDDRLHTGAFQITGRLAEGDGGAGAGSLVLPNGDRFSLTESVISVGRHPDCNLVLADPNVSRNHAEIRPQGDRFAVVDLGSTNGTRVNGVRVDTQRPRRTATRSPSATPGCGSRPPEPMPDQLLNLLKLFLLLLLYLFFLRVLRAVWAEVNPPEGRRGAAEAEARPGARGAPPAARKHGPLVLRLVAPPELKGRSLPARRGGHRRAGRRLPGHPRRHLRVAAARARLPARRAGVRRGPRLHQRHLPQPPQGHRPDAAPAGRPAPDRQHRPGARLMSGVVLRAGAATDVGRVRTINQDAYVLLPDRDLFAVADGMGGHQGGEVASRLAVETLQVAYQDPPPTRSTEAIAVANHRIRNEGDADPDLRGMGTTVVALALVPDEPDPDAPDGDDAARAPRSSPTSATAAPTSSATASSCSSPRTTAWSPTSCATGRITAEEAEVHPQRNIVTRVLGVYETRRRRPLAGRPRRRRPRTCSAPTASSTRSAPTRSPASCAGSTTRPRRPPSWCASPTRAAAATTSPSSSSTWSTTAAAPRRRRRRWPASRRASTSAAPDRSRRRRPGRVHHRDAGRRPPRG